jgi:hypothetical protein
MSKKILYLLIFALFIFTLSPNAESINYQNKLDKTLISPINIEPYYMVFNKYKQHNLTFGTVDD